MDATILLSRGIIAIDCHELGIDFIAPSVFLQFDRQSIAYSNESEIGRGNLGYT